MTGTNDAAVVTGDTTGQVTDQDTSTTGTITVTDPDSGDTATIDNVTMEGNYGTFTLVDGNWTYTVDPDKAQALPEGEEANDTFTLTASDGSTHEIVVTVTGTNDAAVVTGDTTGQVTDQDTSTTGTITVTDPDSGDTATIDNVTMEGNYGTFELVDGEWTYTVDPDKAQSLPEGQEANDTFTLTASDGSTHEIVVTVTGTNDAAVVTGDTTGQVTDQDTSTTGTITVTDPDSGETATIGNTTMEGNYGTFELVDGEWTYTVDPDKAEPLPEGQSAEDTFTLTASDGSTHDVTVTVTGTDNAGVVTGTTSGSVDAAGFTLNVEESGNLTAGDVTQGDNNGGWNTTTTTIDGVPYVISTAFVNGGTTIISRVEDDGSLTETDRIVYDYQTGTVTSTSGGDLTAALQEAGIPVGALGNGLTQSNVSNIDGQPTLFLTSQNSGSISAWEISGNGQLTVNGGLTFGNSQTGIVRENVTFETDDGETLIFATRPQGDTVDVLSYNPQTGEIAETGNSYTSCDWVSGIDIITIDGNTFVSASGNDVVSLYAVDSATGNLTLVDSEPVTSGNGNSVNFYQTPDGTTYAISSSSSADVTTVFEVAADGTLTQTDVIENAGAYMSTAGYVDGEPVFVAPNPDGGVDLYTINSEGSLVHQGNVSSIENDNTPPVIVQTADGSYYLVDADGNTATVKLEIGESLITTSGSLDVVDVDGGDTTVFENTTVEGTYGTLELVDGNWTYTLDEAKSKSLGEGDTAQDVITLTATDGTQQDITITVTGTDELAELIGDVTATVTDTDASVSGSITVVDPDTGDNTTIANTTMQGEYGTFQLVDGDWTYTVDPAKAEPLPEGQSAEDTFTLTASDGSTHDVTVTVTGTDNAGVVTGTTSGSVDAAGFTLNVEESGSLTGGEVTEADANGGRSTTAVTIDGVPYVISTAFGYSGTTIISRVEDDGSLTETDRIVYDRYTGTVTSTSGGDLTAALQEAGIPVGALGNGLTQSNVSSIDGQPTLFLTSQNSGSITTWEVSPDGQLSVTAGLNFGNSQTGIVRENVTFETDDGTELIFATRPQGHTIDTLTYDPDAGTIVENGTSIAGGNVVSGIDIVSNEHGDLLVSSSADMINTYAIDSTTGELTLIDSEAVSFSSANTVNFYEADDGTTYAIASSTSGTTVIYEIAEDGSMTQTDVLEGAGAYSSSAGYVDGQPVFVVPNATEGVDLYTIGSDGNLVHQGHITGIENDNTPPVIVQTADGSYYLVDADGNAATVKLEIGESLITTSGSLDVVDVDGGDTTVFENTTLEGTYGTLELVDGNWTYTLDEAKSESLGEGDTAQDVITLTATDGTQQDITITVTGTNELAELTGDVTATVTDADASVSGSITVVDPDTGDNTTIANTTMQGEYGTFELVDGDWTYTVDPAKAEPLPEGQSAEDTFTLTASDGSTHDVTVTVTGTDNAGVVTGTTSGSVTGDGTDVHTIGNAFIMDENVSFDSGSFVTWSFPPELNFSSDATQVQIIDDEGQLNSDDGSNERSQDATQTISLDGETYNVNVDYALTYKDTEGSTYTFAVVDVDINGDDSNAVNGTESGKVLIQLDGPEISADTSLALVPNSYQNISSLDYSDLHDPITTSGSLDVVDVDGGDTTVFENTTVEGTYGTLELVDGNWTYTLDEAKSESLGEGDTAQDVITLTATDGTQQDITITVTGTDELAELTGDLSAQISEDSQSQTVSGTLSITDVDANDTPSFANTTVAGQYGALSLVDGEWTYTLSDAAQSLSEGQQVEDVITLTATDGTTQDIVITVTGADDASFISGTTSGSVTEGDAGDVITTSGKLSVSDIDSDNVTIPDSNQSGTYGSLSLVDGEWTYTLDNSKADSLNEGQNVTDTFTVEASDGSTQEIVVNITGSDDAATLTGDTTATISDTSSTSENVTINRGSDGTWDVGDGDNLYLNLSNITSDAAYSNSVGYYVMDGSGNVIRSAIIFDNAHSVNNSSVNINTAGGEKVGLFLIPDGDSKGFNVGSVSLSFGSGGVTAYQGGASGTTFVSESSKNGSDFDYEINSGTYSGWEDLVGGGDGDYDDVAFYVTATQQQDQPISASGSIGVSDVDSGDTPTLPNTTVQGEFGELVLTNGNWTYTFDESKSQQIDEETLETIVITDSEGGQHEIVIAIQGTDDAPIVTGVFSGAVTEGDFGDTVTVSGTIAISDPDADDTPEFQNTIVQGDYGTLTLTNGVWTYELDDTKAEVLSSSDYVTDTITLTATDGTVQNINVSITGSNDDPFVVGTNTAAIVAPDSVTSEYVDIRNAFVLNEGYTFSGGDMQYYGNESTFQFNDSGSTIRFYDNDTTVDGDNYINEYVQDSTQKVEINGVQYTATYDYQIDYQDSAGNIYSFAIFDVDLDGDGSFIYDANEWGRVIVQIDGPQIAPGITMDFLRYTPNQPSSMSYSDFTDFSGAKLEAKGVLSVVDLDTNDAQAEFTDTTVNGQYGSLVLTDGAWTYTLDPHSTPALGENDTLAEVITLTATNGMQTQVNVTIGGSETAVTNASLSGVSNDLDDVISLDDVTFSGGDGNDRIAGSSDADVLLGNAGNDVIYGNAGNDIIDGGLGDDLLFGGQGNDLLAGGAGSDTFAFLRGDQGTTNEPAVDHIADFDAQQDAINLSDLLNNETADSLGEYLSFSDDGEGHAMLNISSQGDGNVDQQVVFDNMSVEDMADAYSIDISGMTSEQISSSVIDAMVMQSKMIID
ncbi:VCBS domain-containing protein [Grimontia marina]|uniref:VCBS domain-containing protein n=1 Tax=Grimontia marina TaxID=646534 RepID=UPI001E342C20|nr:VCBS domain-containing protein [Grimontia marina]